jgi:AcrR family transcriptional regulator
MNNSPDVEIKIIEAAIACIEKCGLKNATVRMIAKEAGVNSAAINYYFRSKEQLMERVMQITLENAFDWSHFSFSEEYSPKPRLLAILEHMVTGTQMYPEITKVHFIAPMMDRNASTASYAVFNGFMEKIYDDLVGRGAAPGTELRFALLQAVTASILGIGLHIDVCREFAGQDLKDPAIRRQYLEQLVDRVL